MAKRRPTAHITMEALIHRINRKLAKHGQKLKKLRYDRTRPGVPRFWSDLGDYYVLDLDRNFLVQGHVVPEEMGRELEVLAPFEGVLEVDL